jgi:3-hydroxybutyryl-CoA dehydratase
MKRYRLSDLRIGMSERFEVLVTDAMMSTFRDLSGDINPLHTDASFALAAGHPRPVVFGLLTASFFSTLVGVHLPGELGMLHGIDVDFHSPVYPGAHLIVSGEIIALSEAARRVEMRGLISNAEGKRVARARIRAGVRAD